MNQAVFFASSSGNPAVCRDTGSEDVVGSSLGIGVSSVDLPAERLWRSQFPASVGVRPGAGCRVSLSMRARTGDNREVVGSRPGQCRILAFWRWTAHRRHVRITPCSPGAKCDAAIALVVGAVYGPRVEGATWGAAPPSSRPLMDDGRGRNFNQRMVKFVRAVAGAAGVGTVGLSVSRGEVGRRSGPWWTGWVSAASPMRPLWPWPVRNWNVLV